MFSDLLVECAYGWGRMLRLYQDRLDIHGTSYQLSELVYVQPVYRRMLGISSARLELQFREQIMVIRGIADVALAQKIISHLARRSDITIALPLEEVGLFRFWGMRRRKKLQPDTPFVLSESSRLRYWEYDHVLNQNQHMETATAITLPDQAPSTALGAFSSSSWSALPFSSVQTPLPPVSSEVVTTPVLDNRQQQRILRLKRLQSEREQRMYGFDVEALALRLRDTPLPVLAASLRLHADEVAHYQTRAYLIERGQRQNRRSFPRSRERGNFILTNKRLIYLGRKRQIVLGYDTIVQAVHMPGILRINTDSGTRQIFFAMDRPLECSMYLEHIMSAFSSSTGRISFSSMTAQVSLLQHGEPHPLFALR